MKIFIFLANQRHGPYDYEQIENYLKDGRICESDLVWTEGKADWEPLGEIITKTTSASSENPESDFEKINDLIQKGETEFALDLARSLNCKVLFGKLLENCCFASDG